MTNASILTPAQIHGVMSARLHRYGCRPANVIIIGKRAAGHKLWVVEYRLASGEDQPITTVFIGKSGHTLRFTDERLTRTDNHFSPAEQPFASVLGIFTPKRTKRRVPAGVDLTNRGIIWKDA